MAAPSAAPVSARLRVPATAPSNAPPREWFPIVTPLKADRWQHRIAEAGLTREWADVPEGIRNGFAHGLDPEQRLLATFIPKNLTSATTHPEIIDDYIAKEQDLGRISPGYEPAFLERHIGPFRCSPIGCIQKDAPHGKWRMFNHHSYPRDDPDIPSVNSQIDKDNYPCDWGTFAECYLLVANAPPGAQVRCSQGGE